MDIAFDEARARKVGVVAVLVAGCAFVYPLLLAWYEFYNRFHAPGYAKVVEETAQAVGEMLMVGVVAQLVNHAYVASRSGALRWLSIFAFSISLGAPLLALAAWFVL